MLFILSLFQERIAFPHQFVNLFLSNHTTLHQTTRSKNKPSYTPNLDCGDNVIVLNADKVVLNGDKMTKREYLRYTGYPGGQRSFTPGDLMEKSYKKTVKPGRHPLFIKVVKGMLPKTKLGAAQLNNLYVYNGTEHPFEAMNPTVIDLKIKK